MTVLVKTISIKVNKFIKMSSVCELSIRRDIPITMIHGKLKSHVIIFDPPYDIASILIDFCRFDGHPVKIMIDHSNRDVSIIQPSISHMILQTTVTAFQNHRLQMPVPRRSMISPLGAARVSFNFDHSQDQRIHSASGRRRATDTGKTCSICLENIFDNQLQLLPCAHAFHRRCIARWTHEQPNCPECRLPLA